MMAESVKVVVRCRPMNTRELSMKCKNVVTMDCERCTCSIVNPSDNTAPSKDFTFDGVYSINSTTEQIYNESAYPLIEGVLEGYNSTVFAYGQTGCGKSFTMQGVQDPPMQRGIIPRAFEHIFEAISVAQGVKYLVLASYLEIYNEEIRDLLGCLSKKKLDLKETPDRGVYVQDLSWHAVGSVKDCERLMNEGWSQRSTGATLMNADSSRSHSIFSVCVEMMRTNENDLETTIRKGKLSLVDLAGSERQAKTGASGERLKEASKINLSLSALGNVISALVDGKAKHIPYRDSKLTRLLQDSLGGNTKTLMIACLSPADNNYDETLSTLRYANRAKNIKNKPHINEDPKDTLLRQYQEEIEKLKSMLQTSNAPKFATIVDEALLQKEREKLKNEYESELTLLKEQFKEMHSTKRQVEEEFESLKQKYDHQIQSINEKSVLEPNSLRIIDGVDKIEEEKITELNNNHTSVEECKIVTKPSRQEIMARLVKLEHNLVGGEKAGDQSLRERRARRKRAADRRIAALADVLAKENHSADIVFGVVDDITDQLSVKSEHLKKHKLKVKALEREIQDLQSEFETERTDYLETIRRLERQLKLHQQILEKTAPALRSYNYCDCESIKREARWDEDSAAWIIPDLLSLQSKLPSGDVWRQTSLTAPGRLQKNDKGEDEDFAGSYFKPKRAAELLVRAQQDAARANNIMMKGINQASLTSLNTLVKNNHDGFLNSSWSNQLNIVSPSQWIDVGSRKPIKLESLPILEKKASCSKCHSPVNTLDLI